KNTGYNKKNPTDLIANIAQTFKDRSRKDVGKWRTAIQLAEHPTKPMRQPLMDMINDLMTDGHLKSQIKLRKSVVLNKVFHIVDENGEVDPELSKIINSKWFYDIIEFYVDTDLYGHTLVEIVEFINSKPKLALIPRRNVLPSIGRIVPDLAKLDKMIDFTNPAFQNWLLEMGDRSDLGIINDIIPNLIWKRNIMQSWAEFCERFGIPMVTATTVRTTDESIQAIEAMLQQLGEAAYGVFPEGTTIDFKEANRTDAYQVFDNLIKRCDQEVSKAIVGGTMVSDDGSSKSQSEVHERNLEKRLGTADRREITFFINETILPILIAHGFPFKENHLFAFDTTQEMDVLDHWKIVNDMLNGGKLKPDSVWISKTFNVPLTEIEAAAPIDAVAKKKVMFDLYATNHVCGGFNPSAINFDKQDLDRLQQQLIEALYNDEGILETKAQLIVKEAQLLFDGLLQGHGSNLHVAWNSPDHLMLAMMEQNLFDFATSKTEARAAATSAFLIDPETKKLREFNDFKALATADLEKFNERHLRTEWNLSVAIGQNSAAYIRAMSEVNDFPYVQYITAGDNNVRSEHQILNGKIFNLRDEESRRLWPPNGFGCRCEMIQYPHSVNKSNVTSASEAISLLGDKFKEGPFSVNRAELKKVFLENQMYKDIKGIPQKLASLTFENWKLKPYAEMQNLGRCFVDSSINKDNVKELFLRVEKNVAMMLFNDYFNRKLMLKEKTFTRHTTGKYLEADEIRHQIFPQVKTTLEDPNEVWMTEDGNEVQLTFIKFYSDRVIVVVSNLKNLTGYEIKTWYSMKVNEAIIRKGLLVRSKP
ncbi:MAG: DUF935 family protein, partial [Crocinitomicaceae bacterium]|nr:DUF935 family protein [Crocinitomicaceae bacterium]